MEIARYQQKSRTKVLNQLVNIRTQLEKNLNENFSVMDGIGSYISAYHNISEDSFQLIVRELLYNKPCIKRVTLVRNGTIVSLCPPPQQNEDIGPYIMVNSAESKQAFSDAKKFRKTVIVGPFSFANGDSVVITYLPVFLTPPGSEEKSGRFWGFVGTIIDIPTLLQTSGLYNAHLPVDIVLRDINDLVDQDRIIYGDPAILARDPVFINVSLPLDTWQLKAIPRGGWRAHPTDFWRMQAVGGFFVLCCLFLGLGIFRYFNLKRQTEMEIIETSSLLRATIESTADAILVLDQNQEVITYNHKFLELFELAEGWSDLPKSGQRLELLLTKVRNPEELLNTVKVNWSDPDRIHQSILELKDGRIIERVAQPFRVKNKTVGRLFNYRDITKQKLAEDGLKKSETNLLTLNQQLQIEKERLRKISITDDLTQVYNRRYIFRCLEREINRAKRLQHPLTVIMMDIDHFKKINDSFGHLVGDRVLKTVCRVISKNIREMDYVGRYGGEEFLILLPECALENGYLVAERIRKEIASLKWQDPALCLTISGGVADYQGESSVDFVRRVDALLYQAKNNGRNLIKSDPDLNNKISS